MKIKSYEDLFTIKLLILITTIIEIIFVSYLFTNKTYTYIKLDGIVIKDNLINIVVSKKEQKIIDKNKYLYLNNKKIKYKIIEEKLDIIKKDKNKYNQLILEFKFNNKYKANDIISLTFKNKKINFIEIFKNIIEGD